MDPKNIKVNLEWPSLKNMNEVRSFMGLAGYYMSFIRNFSNIGYPITYLVRKGNKFEWIAKCPARFD